MEIDKTIVQMIKDSGYQGCGGYTWLDCSGSDSFPISCPLNGNCNGSTESYGKAIKWLEELEKPEQPEKTKLQTIIDYTKGMKDKYDANNEGFNTIYNMLLELKEMEK